MKDLSKYVVTKELEDGIALLNTKNNFSVMVTNDLLAKMKNDSQTLNDYEDYLSSNRFFPEENEFEKMMEGVFSEEAETLRLTILTHGDCNFRCLYCYEKFENIGMSRETMDNIVAFADKKLSSGNYKTLRASWFGGEPLLGYKAIVYLSDKFQELTSKYQLKYIADMTTNGYLLDERKFKVLVEDCKCTIYQITIDGNEESHDQQRVLKNGHGSYRRIYDNLLKIQKTQLKCVVILRFNVSKVNYQNVQHFMIDEGLPFKNDRRFLMLYRNVGDWGQGEREEDYQVERLDKDIVYSFSLQALKFGYQLYESYVNLSNQLACYAQNPNNYTFSVRGKIMACTVLLYDQVNLFGDVNQNLLNDEKRKKLWLHSLEKIPEDCRNCEIVSVCKGGACPKLVLADHWTQERICQKSKMNFEQNFDLFCRQNLYKVVLDVE
ncbi:radical SAM protein [Lactovum odontotermitis]